MLPQGQVAGSMFFLNMTLKNFLRRLTYLISQLANWTIEQIFEIEFALYLAFSPAWISLRFGRGNGFNGRYGSRF